VLTFCTLDKSPSTRASTRMIQALLPGLDRYTLNGRTIFKRGSLFYGYLEFYVTITNRTRDKEKYSTTRDLDTIDPICSTRSDWAQRHTAAIYPYNIHSKGAVSDRQKVALCSSLSVDNILQQSAVQMLDTSTSPNNNCLVDNYHQI